MSKSPRVIVAPESPPASPRSAASVWAARHCTPYIYQPGRPRAVVQRSRFTIQNPPEVTAYVNRSSRYSSSPQSSQRQNSSHSSGSSARDPRLFKMDEELNDSFHLPQSTHQSGSRRRRQRKSHSLRRSESMDSLSEELGRHPGRASKNDLRGDSPVVAKTWDPSLSHHRPSNRRAPLEMPEPITGRHPVPRSAPIPIPSRSKQMEERRQQAAAIQKAKDAAAARAASSSSHGSKFYRSYRPSPPRPRHPIYYDSSSDD